MTGTRRAEHVTTAIALPVTFATALAVGPFVLLVLLGVAGALSIAAARRRIRLRQRRIDESAPDLVDLFGIALASGQTVPVALATVAPRAPEPVRPALERADRQFTGGRTLAEVLTDLRSLGPAHEFLFEILADGHHGGAPTVETLERLAAAARNRRRREAETRARRLPVTMLFPLVLCTLPAFALLAVVPLLVTSFTALT